MKTIKLYVNGMHCPSCEMSIERELSSLSFVKSVKSSVLSQTLILGVDEENDEVIIDKINQKLNPLNYSVSLEKQEKKNNYLDLLLGFVIAVSFMTFFFVLQKLGYLNKLDIDSLSYPFVFMIGVIASLSTCMAVVGGLVLSISSTYQIGKDKVVPLVLFHISRIVSFFLLGGVIGFIGSEFKLSQNFYFSVNIIIFFIMIFLGLNLLEISSIFSKIQIRFPKFLTERFIKNDFIKNRFTPIVLGLVTFFLPCGFTQSMQFNAVASGSILSGGLIMLVFALGTFPVLGLISFSSVKFSALKSNIFFKTAGFIIIFFALFNFLSSLVSKGYINPFF